MRFSKHIGWFCILLSGMIIGQSHSAESVDIPFIWGHNWPSGAKALGMGGAYSAIADKQGAILYNPAGLGRIQRTEAYASFSHMTYTSRLTSLGLSSEQATSFTKLNDLGLNIPVPTYRGSLVFSFGYHRIRQLDTALMLNRFANHISAYDSVRIDYNHYTDGSLTNTCFGGAVEAAPDLFMGLSLNVWGGSREYNNLHTFRDNVYDLYYWSRFDSTDHSTTRFSGLNFTLSMLYQIQNIGSIAAVMITPVTLKAKEDWDYEDVRDYEYYPPDDIENVLVWEDEASGYSEYKIRSPWIFRVGGALAKGPVTVSGDIEFIDYSQMRYVTNPPYADMDKASANVLIRRELRHIKNMYFGGEVAVPGTSLKLRGGYTLLENPVKNADNKKRKIWSGGAGYTFSEQFSIDAAYARTSWDGIADNLINDEQITSSKVLVTLSYQI